LAYNNYVKPPPHLPTPDRKTKELHEGVYRETIASEALQASAASISQTLQDWQELKLSSPRMRLQLSTCKPMSSLEIWDNFREILRFNFILNTYSKKRQ
jgi:hypothetical protein